MTVSPLSGGAASGAALSQSTRGRAAALTNRGPGRASGPAPRPGYRPRFEPKSAAFSPKTAAFALKPPPSRLTPPGFPSEPPVPPHNCGVQPSKRRSRPPSGAFPLFPQDSRARDPRWAPRGLHGRPALPLPFPRPEPLLFPQESSLKLPNPPPGIRQEIPAGSEEFPGSSTGCEGWI